MTDAEAFAFHFAELDRRGMHGPVPVGWERSGKRLWIAYRSDYSQHTVDVDDPEEYEIAALGFALTQALADAGNITIHATRNGTNTVATPGHTVTRKPLLAGLVVAYWKAQVPPSP